MAQVITNTFFDDCEAIVNENGRPVLDLDALSKKFQGAPIGVNSMSIPAADLVNLGFSERFIKGFPQSALGLALKRSVTQDDPRGFFVTLTAIINSGTPQDVYYSISGTAVASRGVNAIAEITHHNDTFAFMLLQA